MIKYKCKHSSAKMYLDVLDWNKYKSGFLNRQIIILLKTLGVKDSIFKTLHENHIQNISNLSFKDCSVFKNMTDDFNN
jgi:RNA-dependent RNA polymerase